MIRTSGLLISTVLVLFALAGCGGDGAPTGSPVAPSGPRTPAVTSGTTITGVVTGAAGGSGAGLLGARDVTTVTATVGGITVTATIDSQGNFTLTGLPGGTVTLTFSGTNATLKIQVGEKEKVKIILTLSGGTATVETEEHEAADGKVELEGRVSAKTDTGFYVGDKLVTPDTKGMVIRHGNDSATYSLTTLKVGDRVHVRGKAQGDTVVAELVIVQNTNAKVPVNLKGTVGELDDTTSCAANNLAFTLTHWIVVTSQKTSYSKGKACADLTASPAPTVHVKGDVVDGKVQATSVQFDK